MKFSETRRHQEDRPLTGAVENMRRLGLIRPRDPSWCPVTLSQRAARCWPSAGLCGAGLVVGRRGSGRLPPSCAQGGILPPGIGWTLWQTGRDCNAIAGAQGTGACSRLSPPVPGPRGGRGHTCRVPPRACSVSNATSLSVSARLARKRRTRCNRGCGTCVCWSVLVHWGPPCSDDPVRNSVVTGALVAGRAVT